MVHFLDAVIKPVKFFGVFLKRSKQIVKKICKKPGGRRICQKIRIAVGQW